MIKVDKFDLYILNQLQRNSNITNKELAERVNLSPTPTYERVKKLEKNGYIKKYVAILNSEALNLELIVFCNITLKQHTKDIGQQFVRDIESLREVTECYNISGDYDFLLKVVVKDMKAYQKFVLEKLGEVDNIGSAHSTFVMGEIKNSFSLPI